MKFHRPPREPRRDPVGCPQVSDSLAEQLQKLPNLDQEPVRQTVRSVGSRSRASPVPFGADSESSDQDARTYQSFRKDSDGREDHEGR